MTSTVEFDTFLSDLAVQREKLLRLAGDGPEQQELRDLADQLLTANEELRVQQEELQEANERLAVGASENDAYFQSSPTALVITDLSGSVLRTNTAADQLIRRRPARMARPLATWFQVADRARVRGIITRMQRWAQSCQEGGAAEQVVLRLHEEDGRKVVLSAVLAMDTRSGIPVLRWELWADPVSSPDSAHEPRLRLVTPGPSHPAEEGPAPQHVREGRPADTQAHPAIVLAESLTQLAGKLASCNQRSDLLQTVLEGAIALVPGTQRATLTLHSRGRTEVAAATDEAASACERAQWSGQAPAGPSVQAWSGDQSVTATIPVMRAQWPELVTAAARADIRRVLAVPLSYGEQPLGVMSLYSARPDAFVNPTVRSVAPLVAAQAAVALTNLERQEHLRVAMESRQHIGQAVGILVERHRIRPAEAFERLVRTSQNRNLKVREVADAVVHSGEDPEDVHLP